MDIRFIIFASFLLVVGAFDCEDGQILKASNVDCFHYYQCFEGDLILKSCPERQAFDIESKTCSYTAECINYKAEPPKCPKNQTETVLFPHEKYCTMFYSCTNGNLVAMTCTSGTEFYPELGYCDWLSSDGCSSRTTTEQQTTDVETTVRTTTNQPETTTTSKLPVCDDLNDVFIPHETECTMFYFCINGVPQLFKCPANTEFDPNLNKCVPVSDSGCSSSKPPF